MELPILNIVLLLAMGGIGVIIVLRSGSRSADDVLRDLHHGAMHGGGSRAEVTSRLKVVLHDELASLGLFDSSAKNDFRLRQKLLPVAGAGALLLLKLMIAPTTHVATVLATTVCGAALGYLYSQARVRTLRLRFKEQIEFYLPVVMERLVMAVHAGLDIMAALRAVLELEARELGLRGVERISPMDPVTRLLEIVYRLTESGLGFEQSLREVAALVPSPALRHAFIHLAVAHREGGELVMPLRELSDATQLYYQETVEEEIAKMPVRATLPLLCTFIGLVLFFITSPLVQVIEMTQRAIPK